MVGWFLFIFGQSPNRNEQIIFHHIGNQSRKRAYDALLPIILGVKSTDKNARLLNDNDYLDVIIIRLGVSSNSD